MIVEEKQIEEIKDILGSLFIKYRTDEDIVRLSQWVDPLVVTAQREIKEYAKASN